MAADARPFLFIRVRLYRGGMAEWVRDVLRDEQDALYKELAEAREAGKKESDPVIEDLRQKLTWSVQVLRDIDHALIDLVGPDRDPRPG